MKAAENKEPEIVDLASEWLSRHHTELGLDTVRHKKDGDRLANAVLEYFIPVEIEESEPKPEKPVKKTRKKKS